MVLAVVLVTVALVGLSGCAPRVWTARFYNNTSEPLNVLVASGHDEVRYKIPPQAIGYIWIGEGPIDLGVSVFDESCRKMASRQFAASRFSLLQFGPDPVIDLSEEDAGVGPDPTLLRTEGGCS